MIPPRLPSGWVATTLGECCDIISGGTPRRECPEFWDGTVPWVTPKDISDIENPIFVDPPERITELGLRKSSATLLPKGAILFSSRAPIGLVAIAGEPMATNQGFKSLVPRSCLDSSFLYYAIKRKVPEIAARGNGATFKEVSKSVMAEIEIAFPQKLDEQRRIAVVLKKVDGIRRKRDQALALAEDFLRSAFLQMFGDPVANPKAWPIIELGECIDEIRYGTSTKCGDEKDGDLPVLRIPNIAAGEVNWKDLKYTTLSAAETERLMMKKGDLIFVRTNGNPEYIGRCAVFDENRRALFASYLIRARFSQRSKLTARYAWMALTIPSYRQLLLRETKTTAGNYNISASGLKSLKIPCAPHDLQRKFAMLYDEWRKTKGKIRRDLDDASILVASLSQRAFRGEL